MNLLKSNFLLAILSFTLLLACDNEKECCTTFPDLIGPEWLSVNIKEGGNTTVAPHEAILTFGPENTYGLQLDVNLCGGDINLQQRTLQIDFLNALCTEACCDSDYAVRLREFLIEADSYELSTQDLIIVKGSDQARFTIKN
ncbi:MAG: hypothetical protein AAF242_18740 [Bacteroidota bacterium]